MEQKQRSKRALSAAVLGLGLLSLYLYQTMVTTCIDDQGLLMKGNLPQKLLWAAGIGLVLLLWRGVSGLGGNGSYADNFPRSVFHGALELCAGVVLFSGVNSAAHEARWQLWLGLAACAGMVLAGLYRMVGKRAWWPLHSIVCLYFMLCLVNNYRRVSADPQIHDYAYQVLATALLMLAAFHRSCCDAGILQRKKFVASALGAAFCCLPSVCDSDMSRFYLAGALWAFGSLCAMTVLPPDPEPGESGEPEVSRKE